MKATVNGYIHGEWDDVSWPEGLLIIAVGTLANVLIGLAVCVMYGAVITCVVNQIAKTQMLTHSGWDYLAVGILFAGARIVFKKDE